MKVTLKIGKNKYDETPVHNLEVDGKPIVRTIRSLCECPEDAIVGRDLVDGHDLIRAIQAGHEAGLRGEPLEVEIVPDSDDDD